MSRTLHQEGQYAERDSELAEGFPETEGRLYRFAQAWCRRAHRFSGDALRAMPKVDLHCHLNGSISAPLLAHMARLQRIAQGKCDDLAQHPPGADGKSCVRSFTEGEGELKENSSPGGRMKYCFAMFDNVYKVMDNLAFTRMAVQDLLLHAAAENIVLLEIRTSVRAVMYSTPTAAASSADSGRVRGEEYLRTVVSTVEHILMGGLVCFDSGDLLPACDSPAAEWWVHFQSLYAKLLDETSEGAVRQWRWLRQHLQRRMHVRLIVSMNRGHGSGAAMESVLLAKQLRHQQLKTFFENECRACAERRNSGETGNLRTRADVSRLQDIVRRTCWVTGIDFAGYYGRYSFSEFIPALEEARRGSDGPTNGTVSRSSFGVTIHAGEKPDEEELTGAVLFAPERWGHLVFTDPTNMKTIIARHDPIELCITSNFHTGGYSSIEDHQLTNILAVHHQQRAERSHNDKGAEEGAPKLVDLLTDDSRLAEAMRCRVKRRSKRWQGEPDNEKEYETAVANVCFNTDDRGVFDISLSKELKELLSHPTMCSHDGKIDTSLRALWALQRLSVANSFVLPLELLTYLKRRCYALGSGDTSQLTACDCCPCGVCHNLTHVEDQLPSLCGATCAHLNCVELEWLLETFDSAWGDPF